MLFKKKLQQQIAENTSNKYVIHCMKIMLFLMIGIWILNILNVFPINKKVVSSCMVSSLIFFALGMILWHFMDLNKKYVKYLIILWTVIITTIMETGLTFHAILASVLPILFCSALHTHYAVFPEKSVLKKHSYPFLHATTDVFSGYTYPLPFYGAPSQFHKPSGSVSDFSSPVRQR